MFIGCLVTLLFYGPEPIFPEKFGDIFVYHERVRRVPACIRVLCCTLHRGQKASDATNRISNDLVIHLISKCDC